MAKRIISNQYHLGGIKMPNVHLKNDALKCSWVVKIHNNPAFSLCPSFDFYSKIDVKEILKCNLSPADIDHCWRKKPCQLWVDVLKSWCSLNYKSYDNGDITNQILWFNSNIKILKKQCFIRTFIERAWSIYLTWRKKMECGIHIKNLKKNTK